MCVFLCAYRANRLTDENASSVPVWKQEVATKDHDLGPHGQRLFNRFDPVCVRVLVRVFLVGIGCDKWPTNKKTPEYDNTAMIWGSVRRGLSYSPHSRTHANNTRIPHVSTKAAALYSRSFRSVLTVFFTTTLIANSCSYFLGDLV